MIEYINDSKERIYVNASGVKLPDDAHSIGEGYYYLTNSNYTNGTLYDPDGKELFSFDYSEFIPYRFIGNGVIAAQKELNGTYQNAFMDMNGNIISKYFDDNNIEVCGDLVLSKGKVYDLKGDLVLDGNYQNIYLDDFTQKAWLLESDNDKFTLITEDGTVLLEAVESNTLAVGQIGSFYFYKSNNVQSSNEVDMHYSFKDKDYTIEGNILDSWMVIKLNSDNSCDLIDTISGEILLTGYSHYYCQVIDGKCAYICAETNDGCYDIYKIK